MRPFHAVLVAAAASAAPFSLSLFVACSGSNNNAGDAGSDAANDGFAKGDHASSSSGGEGGMVVGPTGKQIVTTMNLLQVDAVTTDGQVIYTDTTNNNVYAVPIAGGTPAMIVPNVSSNAVVGASGPVALIWANTGSGTVGQLTVWTAAHGPQMLSMKSTVGAAVSKDNTHIAYLDNSTATSTAIAVAGVDGTGKQTLVMSAFVGTKCAVAVGFAANDALASYCPAAPGGDAGAEIGTLTRYSGSSWTPTNISTATQAGAFVANSTGDHVLFYDSAGLEAYNIAGATTAVIDPNPLDFIVTPDGSKVVYSTAIPGVDGGATTIGPFKVSPIASPSPTMLGTGLYGFYAISPDGNWVLGESSPPAMNTNFTDSLLASSTTAGTPQKLNSMQNSSPIGDSFTTDSKFAIYTDTIMQKMTMSGAVTAGNLNAVATTGMATPLALNPMMASDVWQNAAGPGSKIIYNPNWNAPTMFGFGTADLMEIDMSQSAPAGKVLVTQADANFFLTTDHATIAYSYSVGATGQPSSMSGLWAMPVP
jgi:hypothetical protein